MNQKQDERYGGKWSEIDQQINGPWLRSKLLLSNPIFSIDRPLAVFIRVVVDLFHVSPLCGKAKIATFKENTIGTS